MKIIPLIYTVIISLLPFVTFAQTDSLGRERDIIDLGRQIFAHKPARTGDAVQQDKLRLSVLPAAGYTLQTGFAGVLSANAIFRTGRDSADNISAILTNITYSEYKQVILPLQGYIWTKDNKYNIIVDWRFMKYPQYTYGLGGYTNVTDGYRIDYSNIHLYQTLMRYVAPYIYAGLGYNFDYYWNVKELSPPVGKVTDFQSYGLSDKVVASGITLNGLYDSRKNPINATQGSFARVTYRPNFTWMGSDANWQSLIFDLRHYFKFPYRSHNVLAIWSYDWFTTGGTPPYLMLPGTGWDPYSNTGRGYIQGRYRGRNMLYLESEYRFRITRNGLLGGVVYANGESVSEPITNRFETVAPGWGGGLRIRLNKFSNTNIAIDYSLGLNGSRGFFVNLGEVF